MANNEINSDGIIALLCCIKANEASALRELDLSVGENTFDDEDQWLFSLAYGRD